MTTPCGIVGIDAVLYNRPFFLFETEECYLMFQVWT